jgi:enoyl-CoA hydratase
MTDYKILKIEITEGIALVTINRPEALNALNQLTMSELKHFFEVDAAENDEIKGVILTGAGEKAFVAGADIKEFTSMSAQQAMELSLGGQDIFFSIEDFDHPVIAAINGFCLGGGCELAMACHLRIAGEKAKFGQPEVNLGLIPGYGATQRLPDLIGKSKAMELLLTGDMIDAQEALRLGLVNHVVPQGEEIAKATEILKKIMTKAPVAIKCIIESVSAHYEKGLDGFTYEGEEKQFSLGNN